MFMTQVTVKTSSVKINLLVYFKSIILIVFRENKCTHGKKAHQLIALRLFNLFRTRYFDDEFMLLCWIRRLARLASRLALITVYNGTLI